MPDAKDRCYTCGKRPPPKLYKSILNGHWYCRDCLASQQFREGSE